MLKIKHKHHLDFPHFTFPLTHAMEFSPVTVDDNDELIAEIDRDVDFHDNTWQLEERPDTNQLEAFWQHVEEDVQHDPEWVNFSED